MKEGIIREYSGIPIKVYSYQDKQIVIRTDEDRVCCILNNDESLEERLKYERTIL